MLALVTSTLLSSFTNTYQQSTLIMCN
uniref:Uncharacterized protein n=1 Tax=Arundo donax TaxID=35708 RepID=A0A0A9BVJ7_ARUDO